MLSVSPFLDLCTSYIAARQYFGFWVGRIRALAIEDDSVEDSTLVHDDSSML